MDLFGVVSTIVDYNHTGCYGTSGLLSRHSLGTEGFFRKEKNNKGSLLSCFQIGEPNSLEVVINLKRVLRFNGPFFLSINIILLLHLLHWSNF